jgi:hypothetical protein
MKPPIKIAALFEVCNQEERFGNAKNAGKRQGNG